MTIEEYKDRLKGLRNELVARATDAIVYPAAINLLATIKNRINDGGNSSGGRIGNYSTRPMYATVNQFVKRSAFKPQGKDGFTGERLRDERVYRVEERTLKSGAIRQRIVSERQYRVEQHTPQSMYLANGYYQLRQIQGRRVDVKNYNYSGSMLLAYTIAKQGEAVVLGFNSEREALKAAGNQARDGRVFYATEGEMQEYNTEVADASRTVIDQILRA